MQIVNYENNLVIYLFAPNEFGLFPVVTNLKPNEGNCRNLQILTFFNFFLSLTWVLQKWVACVVRFAHALTRFARSNLNEL